jgi:hypothetical protein
MYILCGYTMYVLGYTWFSTIKDLHGISQDIPCSIYHTYTIHMDEDTICMVYTIHIPGIYQKIRVGVLDGVNEKDLCDIVLS